MKSLRKSVVVGDKKSPHGSERRLRSAYGVQIMVLKCSETIRTVLVKPHQCERIIESR